MDAEAIESAVEKVLDSGYRTYDITEDGMTRVSTAKMGDRVCEAIAA